MSSFTNRLSHITLGALLATSAGLPALADDTEIYHSQAAMTGAQPNVLFILDTSGSMDTTVIPTAPPYDPNTTYASAGCSSDRIYYSVNSDTAPSCGSSNWFPVASNTCNTSQAALATSGAWPTFGNPRKQAGQYRTVSGKTSWRSIAGGNATPVEYVDDEGTHGATTGDSKVYIYNGGTGWDTSPHSLWSGSALTGTYRFYSANYLNYKAGPGTPTPKTRLEIVRDVAIDLASSLNGVNLGLMRYSTDAQGGYVLNAVQNIATSRSAIINTLQGFSPTAGNGGTPLSETYYEAALYLKGGNVDYGNRSSPGLSVAASRVSGGSQYKSPLEYQCQKNYVVYLTDGAPTLDTDANAKIASMIGKSACAADPYEPYHDGGWVTGSGICMDDLAGWLSNPQTDLAPSLPGSQTALTYMIGFGSDLAASMDYMNNIARAGGTEHAYTASDVPTLTAAPADYLRRHPGRKLDLRDALDRGERLQPCPDQQ
ncbi:MAG: VWA domain-containing protein [Gammaproteobacteria bacterium]|nr:VWA domain-containing protein [Gammaproteobacteria bacterium]